MPSLRYAHEMIYTWLKDAGDILQQAGVTTARLDAEVLLADELQKDRSWLQAHPDHKLTPPQTTKLNNQISRRTNHEPLAYIRGRQEFYGRDFAVTPNTLTPRPETETMVELLLDMRPVNSTIIDVGTGSGCIIISCALELPATNNHYIGLDISRKALETAHKNVQKHKVQITLKPFDLRTDSLPPSSSHQTVILANLPYVPDGFNINLAAAHEPAFAVYGGADGLDFYRSLFSQLQNRHCTVLTEALPPQHNELATIARSAGFRLHNAQDFIQVFRKSDLNHI